MDTYLLTWVAEAAAVARDAELGAIVEESLAVHAIEWTSISLPGFIVEGPVSTARALAAEACGRMDDAKRFRQEALEQARRAGATAVVTRLLQRDDAAPPSIDVATFVREGDYWTIAGEGGVVRLKDSRGLTMLARLVAEPGRELAALDLEAPTAFVIDAGDAGELLDDTAQAAYRRRLVELEEQLAQAEAWNDPVRSERARAECEALRTELSRAIGLGGRKRRAGSAPERARINVQRRIADAIQKIKEHHGPLGLHLSHAVRTGAYLSYLPERAHR